MKTLTLTIVLAFIATFSYAQFPQSSSPDSCCYTAEDLRASIYLGSPEMVYVKVAKKIGDKVKIRVMENHKVLFQKNYRKWALVDAKYNISQFPDGEYTFEIIQDKKVVFSQTIHNTEIEALSAR
jgi:hypothetical protein